MNSNRTANFFEKNESSNISDTSFSKKNTTPMPKLNFNFKNYMENDNEKFSSGFSFQNELLSKRTYEFLKDKDVCLDDVNLDDNISGDNEESKNKEKDKKQQKNN